MSYTVLFVVIFMLFVWVTIVRPQLPKGCGCKCKGNCAHMCGCKYDRSKKRLLTDTVAGNRSEDTQRPRKSIEKNQPRNNPLLKLGNSQETTSL